MFVESRSGLITVRNMYDGDEVMVSSACQALVANMSRVSIICVVLLALADLSIGRNANTGEFPAHAALYMPNNRFGEGVIINNNHLLTVAQNVFDPISNNLLAPNNITVRAGVINLGVNPPPLLNVIRIYAHEGYNRFTLVNNLAVIRMQLNFTFTPETAIPMIDWANLHSRIVPENSLACDFVGWNAPPAHTTTSLQVINLSVMPRHTCNLLGNIAIRGNVRDQHICVGTSAANTATCNNNPGAVYYCNRRIVGLLATGRQCGQTNSPAIVTQTRWYLDWIRRQLVREDNPGAGPVGPPQM